MRRVFVLPLSGLVADVENKTRPTVWADGAKQKEARWLLEQRATFLPDAACLLLHCSPKQSRQTVAFLSVSVTAR